VRYLSDPTGVYVHVDDLVRTLNGAAAEKKVKRPVREAIQRVITMLEGFRQGVHQ